MQEVGQVSCAALQEGTLSNTHVRRGQQTRKNVPRWDPELWRKRGNECLLQRAEVMSIQGDFTPFVVEHLHKAGSVAFQNCYRPLGTNHFPIFSCFWLKVSTWLFCHCPAIAHCMWEWRKTCRCSLQVVIYWRSTSRCKWTGHPEILDFELVPVQNKFLGCLLGESVSMCFLGEKEWNVYLGTGSRDLCSDNDR